MDNVSLISLKTPEDIGRAFEAFAELRPHLTTQERFVAQAVDQYKEGYTILAVEKEGELVACVGFRFLTTLAWGKVLYIDDLVTHSKARGRGYGKALLDKVIDIARDHGCEQVHLDTGYARHVAHKVYLSKGFELVCHHLALKV